MDHSDHNSLEIALKLLFNKKVQKPRYKVNFYKFMNNETKLLFKKKLKYKVDNCADLGHDEFCKHTFDSAKDFACEKHEEKKGWFYHSNDLLAPLIKERNRMLCQSKLKDGCDEVLKGYCKRLRLELCHAVIIVKKNWISSIVDKVSEMRQSPKTAWDNIKLLKKGCAGHHAQINTMKLRNKSGVIATTDGENTSIASDYFKEVFNIDATVNWIHLNNVNNKRMIKSTGDPLRFT